MKTDWSLLINWYLLITFSTILGINFVLIFITPDYGFRGTIVTLMCYFMIYLTSSACKERIEDNAIIGFSRQLKGKLKEFEE